MVGLFVLQTYVGPVHPTVRTVLLLLTIPLFWTVAESLT